MTGTIRCLWVSILLSFSWIQIAFSQQGNTVSPPPTSSTEEIMRIIEDGYVVEDAISDYLDLSGAGKLPTPSAPSYNVNLISIDELREHLGADSIQAAALVTYRHQKGGRIRSVSELKLIPYWDKKTIDRIAPHLSFEYTSDKQQNKVKGEAIISLSAPFMSKPSAPIEYLGPSYETQVRIRGQVANVQYGLIADKDRYEPIFSHGTKGFDSYGIHITYISDKGLLRKMIIGDYGLDLGLGLIARNSFMRGIIPYSKTVKRSKGILPILTDNYNAHLRGAAIELGHKEVSLTFSYSRQHLDGAYDQRHNTIIRLRPELPHRTEQDLQLRHKVIEQSYAGRVQWERSTFRIGVNGILINWDGAYLSYMPGYFSHPSFHNKKKHSLVSADSYWISLVGRLSFAAEAALSDSKGFAAVATGRYNAGSRGSLFIAIRHLSADFISRRGNSLTRFATLGNEQGAFIRYSTPLPYYLTIDSYLDLYRSLHPRHNKEDKTRGLILSSTLTYARNEQGRIYTTYTYRKENDANAYFRVLLGTDWFLSPKWNLRFVGQYKRVGENSKGAMLSAQATYHPSHTLKVNLLGAIFSTSDFASRTYLYIPRVRFTKGQMMYYGRGGLVSLSSSLRVKNWNIEGAIGYISTSKSLKGTPSSFEGAVSLSYHY